MKESYPEQLRYQTRTAEFSSLSQAMHWADGEGDGFVYDCETEQYIYDAPETEEEEEK